MIHASVPPDEVKHGSPIAGRSLFQLLNALTDCRQRFDDRRGRRRSARGGAQHVADFTMGCQPLHLHHLGQQFDSKSHATDTIAQAFTINCVHEAPQTQHRRADHAISRPVNSYTAEAQVFDIEHLAIVGPGEATTGL
jgi:hypothetical protein